MEKKSEPPKIWMVSCTLRPEKKSPKIADFGDFDFQNPQNQQNLKYKIQPSMQKSWKGDKKHVFFQKLCFFVFFSGFESSSPS